jgi:hypothetical protein
MTAQTADKLYIRVVRQLPVKERLRLAALILNDVVPSVEADESESWSEEDLQDVALASLRYGIQTDGKN